MRGFWEDIVKIYPQKITGNNLRGRIKEIRKAERISKAQRNRGKKKSAFVANPYGFTSSVLDGKPSGRLECPREVVGRHLEKTHGDVARD